MLHSRKGHFTSDNHSQYALAKIEKRRFFTTAMGFFARVSPFLRVPILIKHDHLTQFLNIDTWFLYFWWFHGSYLFWLQTSSCPRRFSGCATASCPTATAARRTSSGCGRPCPAWDGPYDLDMPGGVRWGRGMGVSDGPNTSQITMAVFLMVVSCCFNAKAWFKYVLVIWMI